MNGPYENLMQTCHENPACEYSIESSIPQGCRKVRPSDGDGGGCGQRCRMAILLVLLLGSLASLGICGFVHFSMLHRCKYATFVLDSNSLRPCGQPRLSPAPCSENSSNSAISATYLSSSVYNNALGPWRLAEVYGANDGGRCGFQFERLGTHLIVQQPGLYQLTAQVTFADGHSSHLEWQVGHTEWIAVQRGRDPESGPSQARLEAVRRLGAGEKLSLHLDRGERWLATEASATFVTLVRL